MQYSQQQNGVQSTVQGQPGGSMRPSSGSGGGALSNAGQMMMSSMHQLSATPGVQN